MTNTSSQLLETIEINPSPPPIASVIWLHGLGADGNDFVPIVPELNIPSHLPIRFIFPHAPMQAVTINNGYIMRAWYDIVSLEINKHTDQNGISNAVTNITHLIEREMERGIPTNKIILAGFSQGAVIALSTGLTYPHTLGGILGLSGYLPAAEIFTKANSANKNTPIFLAHGTDDPIVPYFLGQTAHNSLLQYQYTVEWHSYPMGHSVCIEEIQSIGSWLRKIILPS